MTDTKDMAAFAWDGHCVYGDPDSINTIHERLSAGAGVREGWKFIYVKRWRALISVPASITDEVREALAASPSPPRLPGKWRPADQAPADGSRLLYGRIVDGLLEWAVSGFRIANGQHWHDGRTPKAFGGQEPTHFMPFAELSHQTEDTPATVADAVSNGGRCDG